MVRTLVRRACIPASRRADGTDGQPPRLSRLYLVCNRDTRLECGIFADSGVARSAQLRLAQAYVQ